MEEVEGRAGGIAVRGSWLGTDSSARASAVRCTAGGDSVSGSGRGGAFGGGAGAGGGSLAIVLAAWTATGAGLGGGVTTNAAVVTKALPVTAPIKTHFAMTRVLMTPAFALLATAVA